MYFSIIAAEMATNTGFCGCFSAAPKTSRNAVWMTPPKSQGRHKGSKQKNKRLHPQGASRCSWLLRLERSNCQQMFVFLLFYVAPITPRNAQRIDPPWFSGRQNWNPKSTVVQKVFQNSKCSHCGIKIHQTNMFFQTPIIGPQLSCFYRLGSKRLKIQSAGLTFLSLSKNTNTSRNAQWIEPFYTHSFFIFFHYSGTDVPL